MNKGYRKSDILVVPEKSSNKPINVGAEKMEERGMPEENKMQRNTHRTQDRESVPNKLQLIHQKAKADKKIKFTNLMHHIYNIDMLRMAFFDLKKNVAPGVDRVTWVDYGKDLEENLQDLSDRLRRGAYKAKPVRRAYILNSRPFCN